MAKHLGTMLRSILLLVAIGCISAKKYAIMAPNVLHIGVTEQVSIAIFDSGNPVNVKLYLQDYPHRRKTFSQVQGRVDQGSNIFLPVKVEPQDLPDTNSVDKQYVYLVAKSDDGHYQFRQEAKILLSYKDGMVFIQTDKPIYTPRQDVKIRVFPLDFGMKPSGRNITIMVLNPQGIRVQQWKDLDSSTGIISKRLELNDFILLGNWTITAIYGHQDVHNTSVQFEVKEYVLPKFSVRLTVPPYILKTDNQIRINITTRYTYGKPVIGTAVVNLAIAGRNGTSVPFAKHAIVLDQSGVTTLTERLQIIRDLPGNLWFPESSRLEVHVDVIEKATGNKESAVDMSCQFTSSPYLIKFANTAKYFKPGLRFVVKVALTYPNKQPAKNVPMQIKAHGVQGDGAEIQLRKIDDDPNSRDFTDEHGEVDFVIDACSNCDPISIQVNTDNGKLQKDQNALANLLVRPFDPEGGPLIMVRQLTKPGKVGRKIQCESYRNVNDGPRRLSFAVVSRGRILSHNTTDPFDGMFRSWSFRISPQMSPSARLIGYYIDDNGKVVADSVLLEVEDSLPTEVTFPDAYKIQPDGSSVQVNEVQILPGLQYRLGIKAPQGTRLGLLSVDQSVYLLRNDNRLTKKRIFKTAEDLDLGCGVGGGNNNKDIFKNAGVVLMTENVVSDGREDYGCGDGSSRKKRSAGDGVGDSKVMKACCDMGKTNPTNKTCVKLAYDSRLGLPNKECRREFWKCCTSLYGTTDMALLGRSGFDNGDFGPSDEEILDQTQVRSFFPETWIYDEKVVGRGGLVEMDVTIPDTITTWVMQAVAINNKTGLGLATPLRIVGFREYFISLKLPYSVKRGEQVSLLATVFNYHDDEMRAKLYLKGDKHFCSIAADDKLALIGRVDIPANDARSVAVPIVPKRIGEIQVQVSSILQIKVGNSYMNSAGDAVIRTLLVVPEGKEHQKSQSFVLDPMGLLNDKSNSAENKAVKPTQAVFQSQKSLRRDGPLHIVEFSIDLKSHKDAVPASVGAFVYLTGNLLGPVVNTTIQGGLEKFFRQPTGCGEQNMIYLAPNVYVLGYLSATKQLSGNSEENAYRFIQSGYQRELNYRRNDKSFSAFGNSRPGSTWLTAFVMRVFCRAKQFAGINVDENLVCESVQWLIQNQRGDGALPEVHHVIHREMVGGIYGNEGDVAMTAFVLSTLAECKCNGVNSQAAITLATHYLESQYRTLNRPYSMALTAYALSLVNSAEKFKANDRLVQNAVYDNAKQTRYWNAGGNALNVETAGYALLAQLQLGRTGYAGPIVTYMSSQRKGGAGFVSTQDTVVALQALAAYSDKTKGRGLDLRVKITSELDINWKPAEIHITKQNALLRRAIDVTRFLGGRLIVTAKGKGIGLLEVDVRYNLPSAKGEVCKFEITKPEIKEIKEKNPGNLFGPVEDQADDDGDDVYDKPKKKKNKKSDKKRNKKKCKGKNKNKKGCKNKKPKKPNRKPKPTRKPPTRKPPKHQPVKSIHLKFCTRYKERGNTSMSIIDIGILTGFKPEQKSLQKLEDDLPELDKYEVSDRSLVLYLSEIPNDRHLCVNVQFDREYYVGVVQVVPIIVYDYYEPDESCSVFYGPDKHSPLKLGVCDIGSRSCKCTQDECAQHDPPIGNIPKLINMACLNYNYVIKGKVVLIDEQNAMLAYVVQVVKIIKQGNKILKAGGLIELWKRGACQSPDLKENKEYLFMGRDEGERYELDKTSFVKLWPQNKGNKDKTTLDDFAAQLAC